MTNITFLSRFLLLASLGALTMACLSGCGNDDSAPPKDPSYSTEPMKGKGQAMAEGSTQ